MGSDNYLRETIYDMNGRRFLVNKRYARPVSDGTLLQSDNRDLPIEQWGRCKEVADVEAQS